MGREVRKVPAGWEHPKSDDGYYVPLFDGDYESEAREFLKLANERGLQHAVDYMGCPTKDSYMPSWSEEEKTHYMMYETTSEGTPISPAFKTPEELARWLEDTGASAFGSCTATYEQWLKVANGGYAPSACYTPEKGLISGVEAMAFE